MKLAVFTAATPELDPVATAQQIGAQGWQGIEWRVVDQKPDDPPGFWAGNRSTWPMTGLLDHAEEMASVAASAGLEISGVGGYAKSFDHEGVQTVLTATARMGAKQARVSIPAVGPGESYREVFDQVRTDIAWAADLAADLGVKALVELHHRTVTASASAAMRLIDGLDPAAVGVIHDLGNLLIEGQEDPRWAFDLLGDYLAHVHVKNALWRPVGTAADGTVSWEHDWATLRAGIADVGDYLTALRQHGYDDWVVCEDFSTELGQEQRLTDDLAYLRSLI